MIKLLEKTAIDRFSKSLGKIAMVHTIADDLKKHEVFRADHKSSFLYRSYIVYLVAVWQTFLVDLAQESQVALLSKDPNVIFHAQLRSNLERYIKRFSTPSTGNIDELIEMATGIKKISTQWEWTGLSNPLAKQTLNELIDLRNTIAHTAYTDKKLSVKENYDYMKFLFNLGCTLNNVIGEYIKNQTGEEVLRYRKLQYEDTNDKEDR